MWFKRLNVFPLCWSPWCDPNVAQFGPNPTHSLTFTDSLFVPCMCQLGFWFQTARSARNLFGFRWVTTSRPCCSLTLCTHWGSQFHCLACGTRTWSTGEQWKGRPDFQGAHYHLDDGGWRIRYRRTDLQTPRTILKSDYSLPLDSISSPAVMSVFCQT